LRPAYEAFIVPPTREPKDLPALNRAELLALVVEVPRQITEWRAEIDQLTRGGKRPAAPVSQGPREPAPKRPGRPPRSGPCHSREAPPPEAITRPSVDVKVTGDACPTWGGPLAEEHGDVASGAALPARPRPPVTPYGGWGCRSTVWGQTVRGQPPALAPDHAGAPAHRLGARVLAAAHAWQDGVGLPVRTVPAVWCLLRGGPLPPGAWPQEALRRAAGTVGLASAPGRAAVPAAPVVHTADPGGRVGGEPAPLLACATAAVPVSQLRPRQRPEEGQEVMPAAEPGVLVTDQGRRADAHAFANVRPPQGGAPRQRSLRDALAPKTGRARACGGLTALRQAAVQLWHADRDGPGPDVPTAAKALPEELTSQLRARRLRDPDP
jgi:hypothetical protein